MSGSFSSLCTCRGLWQKEFWRGFFKQVAKISPIQVSPDLAVPCPSPSATCASAGSTSPASASALRPPLLLKAHGAPRRKKKGHGAKTTHGNVNGNGTPAGFCFFHAHSGFSGEKGGWHRGWLREVAGAALKVALRVALPRSGSAWATQFLLLGGVFFFVSPRLAGLFLPFSCEPACTGSAPCPKRPVF